MKKKTHPAGKAGPIAVSRARRPVSSAPSGGLAARIERLEALEEIRMLAAKYSLSLDMRDLDAHVNLFAPDIRVGRERVGRGHLKTWVDATLRHQFTGTSHHLGGHIIEFTDATHAHGVVYSKNEHETGSDWVIMQMLYWDDYERIRGRWYFRRRLPCYWYATDLNKPPLGANKMRWPGREPYEGTLARAVAVVEAILGRSRGGRRGRGRSASPARGVPEDDATRRAGPEDPGALRMTALEALLQPLQLGGLSLRNRIVMAPMTRSRALPGDVPGDLAVAYYGARAAAGMIVTEGTQPSRDGKGYARTPGIHTEEQILGWRRVTEAVHAAGGCIVLQLMHCGRIASHHNKEPEARTVAPSALRAAGKMFTDQAGLVEFDVPEALTLAEVAQVIAQYAAAARAARRAGFDGIELHAASGYLPMQFLSSGTNQRRDAYGGDLAGRLRFVIETLEALCRRRGRRARRHPHLSRQSLQRPAGRAAAGDLRGAAEAADIDAARLPARDPFAGCVAGCLRTRARVLPRSEDLQRRLRPCVRQSGDTRRRGGGGLLRARLHRQSGSRCALVPRLAAGRI